jgi:hypothetical protein
VTERDPTVHLELVLELLADADHDRVQQHLRGLGLDPLPIKAGIALSAELEDLRKLLPTLSGAEAGEVPVPEALKAMVRSIHIFKPRSLH